MAGSPYGILVSITQPSSAVVGVDSWFQPWQGPVRLRPITLLPFQAQHAYFTQLDPVVSKWLEPFSEPDGLIAMVLEGMGGQVLIPISPPPPPPPPTPLFVNWDYVPDQPAMIGY